MIRSAVGFLAIGLCVNACTPGSADDVAPLGSTHATTSPSSGSTAATISSTLHPSKTSSLLPAPQCTPGPSVELRDSTDVVDADLVYFEESSPTCQLNADGAVIDPSFRPERVLVVPDGRLELVVDEPGDVRVDIRELRPNDGGGVLNMDGRPLVGHDGTYPLALPGSACFVVTIAFETDTRSGQYLAFVAPSADMC